MEVISPESAGRDRGDKYDEYASAGIPEYWLIDPTRETAEFYRLDTQGRYTSVAPDADGQYHAQALTGFILRPAWLWQDALPDPVDALLAIDPEGYSAHLRERLRQAGM